MNAHQMNAACQQVLLAMTDLTNLAMEEADLDTKRSLIDIATNQQEQIHKLLSLPLTATEEHEPFQMNAPAPKPVPVKKATTP